MERENKKRYDMEEEKRENKFIKINLDLSDDDEYDFYEDFKKFGGKGFIMKLYQEQNRSNNVTNQLQENIKTYENKQKKLLGFLETFHKDFQTFMMMFKIKNEFSDEDIRKILEKFDDEK